MKRVIHPDYASLESFLHTLPVVFPSQGTVLYRARNEIRLFDQEGYLLNIKRFRNPIFINRIAYTFLRPSKARRSYENALKLLEKGFGTPTPVAYLENFKNGLLLDSYYISLHLPTVRTFKEFFNESELNGREGIATAFGFWLADLHRAGFNHLDLSNGNVLFAEEEGSIRFWLVDLNRMKHSFLDFGGSCRNMERLRGSKDFFRLLTASYAEARSFDPEACYTEVYRLACQSKEDFALKARRKKKLKSWKDRKSSK